jgi:O-antigen ligase
MAVGIPILNPIMSIGQFLLAGNWLLEGRFKERLSDLFSNKLALVLISLFLLHVLGMAWTETTSFGLKDLRVKLPLLLLPFMVFTSERITAKQFKWLLGMFVLTVTVASMVSFLRYLGFTGEEILDRRQMTFIPHIRFALAVVVAMAIVGYYLVKNRNRFSFGMKVVLILTLGWLFYFQVLLESASGYAALSVLLVYLVIRGIVKSKGLKLKIGLILLAIIGGASTSLYLKSIVDYHYYEIPFDKNDLEIYAPSGRVFGHETATPYCENGHRVYNYVQMEELKPAWNKASDIDFNGEDARGQLLWTTLLRYMTSIGLHKDSADFQKMTQHDIELVEQGVSNETFNKMWGVASRFNGFLWEIDKYTFTGDPTSSSLIQRWIYLDIGVDIFKKNWLTGVGTGDTQQAFNDEYENRKTSLPKVNWARTHNQFLTMFLTFGILGGAWFLFTLAYPVFTFRTGLLYSMFLLVLLVSMLADDTLETQAGVTLFAYFNVLFLLRKIPAKSSASIDP